MLMFSIHQHSTAQIIFNEVQADAGNNESGGEWIELKNISNIPIDMSCWRISNGGSYNLSIPSGLILQAGQYLLIGNASLMSCANCDYKLLHTQFTFNADGFGIGSGNYTNTLMLNTDVLANGGCSCMSGTGALNNGSLAGDRLVMYDANGAIIDAIMYAGGDFYGTAAINVSFAGTSSCPPLAGLSIPGVGDVVYNGRIICNDLSSCNSSYARIPDGNNGASITWSQTGNTSCTGCSLPCLLPASAASTDWPTPGLPNNTTTWSATLNGQAVSNTQTNITVCGATPITFVYEIDNFANVALSATQSSGNLGSYMRINNASPINFSSAVFNPLTGTTTLTAIVTPPNGITNYEFVWGDANTQCAVCPGSSSTTIPNNSSSPAKECYVYKKVTVERENELTGTPSVNCTTTGSITISGLTGTNIQYSLQKQSSVGGPFVTIAGPQASNSFSGIIDDDADPALPNYQVAVNTVNTSCTNPSPIIQAVPSSCMGNPPCASYVTSGSGQPTFIPASSSIVCAGSAVQFDVSVNGVCDNAQIEVLYDYDPTFDPYIQGTSLGTSNTVVGAVPPSILATGKVFINEFVPRPGTGSCAGTPNGQNPNSGEWLELYNAGPGAVDIGGWAVSDGDWTATIPTGTVMPQGSYYLIGGGGTFCSSGVLPDLNIETCNCTTVSPSSSDIMNLTDANEQLALFDCSGNFIDGVLWGGGQGLPDNTNNVAPATGCGNYISSKNVDLPIATSFANTGSAFTTTSEGRYRTSSNTWTTFNAGSGSPKAANPGGNWDGNSLSFGSTCPPPPVTASVNVLLPDTCSTTNATNITLKAIYKPAPSLPCNVNNVIATAHYTIPSCTELLLSGSAEYCAPATASLTVTPSSSLAASYQITLSNGIAIATISNASGSGPFTSNVTDAGNWIISNVTTPIGTCAPKLTGEAEILFLTAPQISSVPLTNSFCYLYGYDLSILNNQIVSNPLSSSYNWYTQATGGSPISTFVNPSTSTTYYAAPVINGNTIACEGAREPVLLQVNSLPAVPTLTCDGSTVTITAATPSCNPSPCSNGVQYSANGIQWSTATQYTAASPGWSGWGQSPNDVLYIRNTDAPSCFNYVTYLSPCAVPLPVTLLSFEVSRIADNQNEIRWQVADQVNVSHYEIERKSMWGAYQKIATVYPNSIFHYTWQDKTAPSGKNYYRLKIVDIDEQYSYSEEKYVQNNVSSGYEAVLFPNPVDNELNIGIQSAYTQLLHLRICDMTGRVLYRQTINHEKGSKQHNIPINAYTNGKYILYIESETQKNVLPFVKQ